MILFPGIRKRAVEILLTVEQRLIGAKVDVRGQSRAHMETPPGRVD